MKRTDMACDFLPHDETDSKYVRSYTVTVDKELSRKLRRPEGRYCTVECRAVPERNREKFREISAHLSSAIERFIPKSAKTILVVGLGNPNMTADSLGAKTCAKISASRTGASSFKTSVGVVTPNVLGVTGIESFDVVAGVVQRTMPDAVIAVDSLASAAVTRIASAFQTTDTGITPGSGVSNHRNRLCRESLGVPVISVGVPLVVYASTIIEDATGEECPQSAMDTVGNMIVTPKDIDLYVCDCAEIISCAIDKAFD